MCTGRQAGRKWATDHCAAHTLRHVWPAAQMLLSRRNSSSSSSSSAHTANRSERSQRTCARAFTRAMHNTHPHTHERTYRTDWLTHTHTKRLDPRTYMHAHARNYTHDARPIAAKHAECLRCTHTGGVSVRRAASVERVGCLSCAVPGVVFFFFLFGASVCVCFEVYTIRSPLQRKYCTWVHVCPLETSTVIECLF